MTTKDHSLPFKGKHDLSVIGDTATGRYGNLNLNQKHKNSTAELVHSNNFSNQNKKVQNYDVARDAQISKSSLSWKKSENRFSSELSNIHSISDNKSEFKDKGKDLSSKNKNNSTLSLHIAAYENSVEAAASDSTDTSNFDKSLLNVKQMTLSTATRNPFEFPRQQSEKETNPGIMQFTASQKLLNPNQGNDDAVTANRATDSSVSPANPQIGRVQQRMPIMVAATQEFLNNLNQNGPSNIRGARLVSPCNRLPLASPASRGQNVYQFYGRSGPRVLMPSVRPQYQMQQTPIIVRQPPQVSRLPHPQTTPKRGNRKRTFASLNAVSTCGEATVSTTENVALENSVHEEEVVTIEGDEHSTNIRCKNLEVTVKKLAAENVKLRDGITTLNENLDDTKKLLQLALDRITTLEAKGRKSRKECNTEHVFNLTPEAANISVDIQLLSKKYTLPLKDFITSNMSGRKLSEIAKLLAIRIFEAIMPDGYTFLNFSVSNIPEKNKCPIPLYMFEDLAKKLITISLGLEDEDLKETLCCQIIYGIADKINREQKAAKASYSDNPQSVFYDPEFYENEEQVIHQPQDLGENEEQAIHQPQDLEENEEEN